MTPIPRQGQQAVKRSRDRLFATNPDCHWCAVKTIHPSECEPFHKDMATLDHVKSRRECKSFEEYSAEKNHVLSCLECNQIRDAIDIQRVKELMEKADAIARLKNPKRPILFATRRGHGGVR